MSRHFDALNEAAAQLGSLSGAEPQSGIAYDNAARRTLVGVANDQIARLVQGVFLSPLPGEKHTAVVFCGIDRGAGCSWVCARSAELLAAQTPGRVCVIDANLRSPTLHRHFRSDAGPGFAEAVCQSGPIGSFVRSTWTNHLWLMSAGSVGAEPNGAFNAARVQTRFAELRNEFDFLLVDVPAISLFSDALLLGQLSDGIVLVIASNSTRRESARMAKHTLEDAKVPILGAVLNKRTYPIPEAVYRRL